MCVYVEGENMEKKDTCKSECTCKSTYEDDPGLIVVYSTDAKIHHNYLTIASCPEHSELHSKLWVNILCTHAVIRRLPSILDSRTTSAIVPSRRFFHCLKVDKYVEIVGNITGSSNWNRECNSANVCGGKLFSIAPGGFKREKF